MARTPHGWRTTKIAIEAATPGVGPVTGFPVETFAPLGAPLWAFRAASTGGERDTAGQLVAEVGIEWRIPYRPDCDPDLVDVPKLRRLRANGRVYDVLEAERVGGRRLEIRLVTREKVTGP